MRFIIFFYVDVLSLCKMSGDVEHSEHIFTWRIKNYFSCYQVKGNKIRSPSFTIENLSGSQWCLWLYPKGEASLDFGDNCIACYLNWKALDESIKTVTISYNIEIVDEKDSVLKCLELKDQKYTIEKPTWGWKNFFDIGELDREMNNWLKDVLKIRCRIKSDKQRKQTLFGSIAYTTMKVDRFCVGWCVKIPSLFEYSESITFPISNYYKLKITLNSVLEAMEIIIHFELEQLKSIQQVTFTISIFDITGCKLGSKRAKHFFEKEETWKFPDFITKELLKICEINASHYEFKLKFEICISKNSISSSCMEELDFVSPCGWKSIPRESPSSPMQSQFRNLLISKQYSDVTIRSKGGEFPAHKFVLRVRSPVFAAMFDQDMLENKTGVVDIDDLEGETLKAFLEYLYTETVEKLDYDIAKSLMVVADKYQVLPLVDMCASFLKSNMSEENVCEIIEIADLLNCENLKYYALNFIKIHAAEILPTPAWTEWIEGNVKLATQILSKLSAAIGTEYKLI